MGEGRIFSFSRKGAKIGGGILITQNLYSSSNMRSIRIFFCLFCACIALNGCKIQFDERNFIQQEINGAIIEVEKSQRGISTITIVNNTSKDTLNYSLYISSFIKESNVKVLDSVSKEKNSHSISFYRKENGSYKKYADLKY